MGGKPLLGRGLLMMVRGRLLMTVRGRGLLMTGKGLLMMGKLLIMGRRNREMPLCVRGRDRVVGELKNRPTSRVSVFIHVSSTA